MNGMKYKMTDQEFEFGIQQIKEGFRLWNKIILELGFVKDEYILVFPHCNHLVNEVGLKYLSLFTRIKKPDKIAILCQSKKIYSQIASFDTYVLGELLSETEMKCLLACYSAVNLSGRIIIMSLTEPIGRYGEKVIENKGVDIDQVVLLGIYGLCQEEIKNEVKKNYL